MRVIHRLVETPMLPLGSIHRVFIEEFLLQDIVNDVEASLIGISSNRKNAKLWIEPRNELPTYSGTC